MRQRQKRNWRVEVEPDGNYIDTSRSADENTCLRIVARIRRHVDEVASALVKWDTFYVCEFCGDESDDATFVECCDEAIEEARATEGDGE